jgi:hypothetical protein
LESSNKKGRTNRNQTKNQNKDNQNDPNPDQAQIMDYESGSKRELDDLKVKMIVLNKRLSKKNDEDKKSK